MNRQTVFIAGGIMVALFVALVYFFSGESNDERIIRKFVSDKWEKEFGLTDKDPQGLSHFKQLVESKSTQKPVVIQDSLEVFLDSTSTYIFAGDQFGLHPKEFRNILSQVRKGADLFLSYHMLTENLHDHFFDSPFNEWHYSDKVTVFGYEKTFSLYSIFQTDTVARRWNLITPENLLDTNFTVLSYMMETPNFVELNYGEGTIYLHANPEMFVNHQLLTKNGFAHAQYALEGINEQYAIKWLELGRLNPDFGNSDTDQMEGDRGRKDNSLLQLIFTRKELTIALLLTILGLILYLAFRTKRYWTAIPYLPKSKNRSLDFADTMTAIYFNQQSPYSMLIVMRKNFYASVNRHFFLDISKEDKTLEMRMLSEKSGMELQRIAELVNLFENGKMQSVTYEYIQDVAKRQREFYLNAGIIKDKARKRGEQKKIEFKRQMVLSSALIFLGINAVLRGFYLLAKAEGGGIIFWPLGVVMLAVGIYLFNRKLLVADKNELTWYPYFAKRQTFEMSDILEVKTGDSSAEKGFTTILFTGNRKLRINHMEISRYSRKDFESFIAPYLKL